MRIVRYKLGFNLYLFQRSLSLPSKEVDTPHGEPSSGEKVLSGRSGRQVDEVICSTVNEIECSKLFAHQRCQSN